MNLVRKRLAALRKRSKVVGYNPVGRIHKAARDGDLDRVRHLLVRGGSHVNDIDKKNRTPLHYACAYGQADVVAFLVKKKCDIHLCDSDNNTPLIKAIQQQEEECAIILLENGVNVNVQDPNGEIPLHHAVYTNNISVAAKLLLHNANIEARNKDGCTPLLLALKENKHHMAEFLIKAKANIHAVDTRGRTALMLAVRYESSGIIKLLIEGGIDVFAEDVDGWTALCYSITSGCNMKIILDCTKEKRKARKNTPTGDEISTEDSLTRHTEKTSNEKSKVRKEINVMEHLDESQPSVTASVDSQVTYPNYKDIWEHLDEPCPPCEDSHNLPKIQNAVDSCQRIVERETSHCSQCLLYMQEMAKLENKFCAMKEELSKKENENSELEQREIKWKQELCKLRHDLEEKEKKLRDFENMNNQLSEKEEKHNKEIELNKELQLSSGTLKTELKTARSNSNQVSTRNETEKELLHKYHMLKDEYDMLSLEMNKIKCQKEKEKKKYLNVIDASREKCDDLQRTIRSIEETLHKITFQYKEEINFMKAEITKLNIKLENQEQNTERQETEVKPYSASQSIAPHPCDERQTSKTERERLSQRARDECLDLKDKGNFKISKRNLRRLIPFPKFSKPGIKCRSQGKGLCIHIRHDLRKMTLVLNQVQRDLKETQCQVNEMKRMYQNEQSQNYKERESIDEKLFQMESEITLLGQQSHDLCNKVDDREDLLVYTQEQCNIIKIIQNEAENSIHELQNSSMELMNRNHHFKERLNQYKKNTEGKVVVRQLQQELADNLTEQCVSEASLEHSSSNHLKVKDEAWGLKKKLDKITCEADKLNSKLEVTSSKYLQLNEQYELSLKSLQNTCEKLQNNQKKLEEYVANFKRYMQNNITEHGQEEPHKWETEQRTREILEEHQKQASPFSETYTAASKTLDDDEASLLRLMQSRIHKLESQVSEINNEISDEIQSPHRITRSLQEVHSGFPVKKQRGCSPCSHCGRPVPGCPCFRLKRDNWLHNRSFIQGENIAGATSNPQPSSQSIEDNLAEMNEKLSRDFI